MYSKTATTKSIRNYSAEIKRLREAISQADSIIIGAGAGLSTSAGFTYTGQRFQKYFSDFAAKYGFQDMYSGGFYPYDTLEEHWTYWSRYVFINRYMDPPKPVYDKLYHLVKDKDYFVLTTNVDHCFQKAGFAKDRLFYTQGDYGLFQCGRPCGMDTYDNYETIRAMVLAQGFQSAISSIFKQALTKQGGTRHETNRIPTLHARIGRHTQRRHCPLYRPPERRLHRDALGYDHAPRQNLRRGLVGTLRPRSAPHHDEPDQDLHRNRYRHRGSRGPFELG